MIDWYCYMNENFQWHFMYTKIIEINIDVSNYSFFILIISILIIDLITIDLIADITDNPF